mgnify:CR=1 FL=1
MDPATVFPDPASLAAAVGETSRVAPAWLPFAPYAVVSVLHVVLLALEHPLAGLRIKRGDGGQGAGFLHIKQAALVQGGQAGPRVSLDEVRAFRPRHRRAQSVDGAGGRAVRPEQQVDAQRAGIRLIQRVKLRNKACFTEQALHSFFKFFRQWLHIT